MNRLGNIIHVGKKTTRIRRVGGEEVQVNTSPNLRGLKAGTRVVERPDGTWVKADMPDPNAK